MGFVNSTIPCPEKRCNGVLEMNPLLYVKVEGTLDAPSFSVCGLDTEDTKVSCNNGHFTRVSDAFLESALQFLRELEYSLVNPINDNED